MSMRSVGVRLRMATGQYKQDTAEAGQATDKLSEKITRAGEKNKADLDKLTHGAALFGAALLGVAAAVVITAAKFDKQMSEVGAVAGATAGDLDRLREAAIDAGAATSFSATEAAQAEAELAKAGIATADILSGALSGALDLAAAGGLDLATAAEIAAAAMNTFKLEGKDVGHIADVLAAAANKSSAGVDDLGQGLQQVGLIAAQVGLSLDETVAVLAAFADYGLKGSDGATSLKTALLRLAAPTGAAAETMTQYGLSLYDANGQMVDAATIAGQLQKGLKDLSPAQRNAALNTIFGSDAIRAANVLYAEGEQGIKDYVAAVDDQGAAADMARAKTDNLAGDFERLTGSLESLALTSSGGATSGLRDLTQGADRLVQAIGQIPKPVLETLTVLVGVGGAGLLAAAGALKFRRVIGDLAPGLAAAYGGTTRLSRGLRGLTTVAGAAGVALAVLTVAAEVFDHFNVNVPILSDAFGSFTNKIEASTSASAKAAKVNKVLTDSMEDQIAAGDKLTDIWDTLHGAMVTSDSEALQAYEAIDKVTEAFKENGKALDQHSKKGLANRVAMEEAAKEAVEAAEAYREQTGDAKGAAQMLEEFKKKAEDAAVAAGGNADKVKALADELYKLPPAKTIDIHMRWTGLSLNQAIAKLNAFENQEQRWGGVTEHAQTGLLRDAGVYSAKSPARYAYAEPATGGEAFVPKKGNYGRSMSILQTAAGWYGASVVAGGSAGGMGPMTIENHIEIGGEVVRVVRHQVDESNRAVRRKVGAR